MTLLDVRNLRVAYPGRSGPIEAVRGVSFELAAGDSLGIVGESGSGKSTLALALLRLPGAVGTIAGGAVMFEGRDLARLSQSELRSLRGRRIAMILQDPLNSLNPLFTNGAQIAEGPIVHEHRTRAQARARAIDLLSAVRIADPALRAAEYPHQISGGMRQRVAGAIALSCNPALLIADEPTTALDPTVQAQYLDLLASLQREHGFGLILISHDLNVVRRTCRQLAVMYAGRIVEAGPVARVLEVPLHPYSRALVGALPSPRRRAGTLAVIPGQPPDIAALARGCAFRPRCALASEQCALDDPPARTIVDAAGARSVACFNA